MKDRLVLGIESSCDETAVALVRSGKEVLVNEVASQIEVHAVFGGVVPEVASREHLRVIDPLFQRALDKSGVSLDEIDAIAVSQGPGLIGALLVGASFAKGLSIATGKPLIPVDHVHAHVHGALLGVDTSFDEIFPTLALVVSGGHTNLYLMPSATEFKLLASTIDDACGESFDKVAKKLGLKYPGGPQIEILARTGDPSNVAMPTMVQEKKRMEFSYSGLKTHVINLLRKQPDLDHSDLCAAFQEEALGQIIRKIGHALDVHDQVQSIVIAGGVAANLRFRELSKQLPRPSFFPKLTYCSDNAAMIAAYGYHLIEARENGSINVSSERELDWDAYSRYDYAAVLQPE